MRVSLLLVPLESTALRSALVLHRSMALLATLATRTDGAAVAEFIELSLAVIAAALVIDCVAISSNEKHTHPFV